MACSLVPLLSAILSLLSSQCHVDGLSLRFEDSSRRSVLNAFLSTALGGLASRPLTVSAQLPFEQGEHRQLELCLVSTLRVVYWAKSLSKEIVDESLSSEQRKQKYVEARMGAKAIFTGGKGVASVSPRIYALASLQLLGCLEDLDYYATNKIRVGNLRQDLREALANLVEFDGFDTLIDPSPRVALILAQYSESKATYVRRVLTERIIPAGEQIVQSFDASAVERSYSYLRMYYGSEMPSEAATSER